ncbi:LacI family DNA-binding transcriptional regulator [Anaerocolumna jejuensis]|uniref:LacI family DNA-binding transcriptional regulator n=1 Tax=Anaerocolumna jejuensis TaxID=259063 RepID=UPI003F7B9725
MSATISDIAEDAKVSISTVSRVMNGSKTVSDDLKERVMKSVEKLNYVPNAAARSLITQRTDVIAVVEADLTNPVTATILREIDQCCMKNNKIVMNCDYDYSNKKAVALLNKLQERNVDGIIFMGVSLDEEILKCLRKFECPVILAQQGVESEACEFTTITDDSYHAASDVTNFLIHEGHRRIAYIGGEENDYTNNKLRLKGFLDTMKDNGLEVPDSYIVHGEFSLEAGKKGMQKIYENNLSLPTAVISGSDLIAVGAIRYLESVKIKVPEDVSVFGFDDSVSNLFELPLSTVRSYDRGKILCEQLFRECDSGEEKKWLYYPYKVLRRNSTRRIG